MRISLEPLEDRLAPSADQVLVSAANLNLSTHFSEKQQTLMLTANVTDDTNSSTTVNEGTVSFTVEDGTGKQVGSIATGPVGSSGTATASFTLPAAEAIGNYTVHVSYSDSPGSSNFTDDGTDTPGALAVTSTSVLVKANDTSTTFSTADQPINLTASVTDPNDSTDIVNEGTVNFIVTNSSSGTQIGTASGSVSNGTASGSFTLPANTAPGSYTLTTSYTDSTGNFTDDGTNTPGTLAVTASTTTTASAATANFSTSDQSVNLTATVASDGTPVTTGTVTFTVLQGTRVIGTATPGNVNSSGQATASYTLPGGTSAGVYTIDAAYHDSTGTFADSSDNTQTLTVSNTPAATATTTKASAASAPFSTSAQDVTLTATVTPSSGSGTVDTGSVQFTILQGSTVIGTPVTGTVSNGTATVTNYSLPAGTTAGTYTIEADYFDPSGAFEISSDASQKLTVNAAPTTTTTTNAAVGFNTGTQSVTLNATVTSSGGTVNEGKVTFTIKQGNTTIGTATSGNVNSSGQASVSYALPAGTPAGSYTIDASYSDSPSSGGSGNFAASDNSSKPSTLTVSAASTTTTAHSATTAFSGSDQNVTLTATVTPTSISGTVNEGSVTFTIVDNKGNTIGTATTGAVSNGQAIVSYVVPGGTAAGSYVIEADYSDSGGSFGSSKDHTQTLSISTASATTVRLTTVSIVPSLSNSTAQVTLTAQVNNAAGAVTDGVITFTLAGVSGHGNVSHGTASVQLTVPLGAVSNLATAGMSYTDKSASGNFSDVSNSATVTTNLLNALLPADLTFDSSGNVQNHLNVAGNTSLLGFSYLASGLLADVLIDSISFPLTYSNVGGNTVTTVLGAPTAVTFVGPSGQVLGKAEVFFDGTQLQWILYDSHNNPIGEVPYTGLA